MTKILMYVAGFGEITVYMNSEDQNYTEGDYYDMATESLCMIKRSDCVFISIEEEEEY